MPRNNCTARVDYFCVEFCEERFGGLFRGAWNNAEDEREGTYLPAIGSSASALVIIWFGFHTIFFWKHESPFHRMVGGLLCVNGICSFAYHSTAHKTFGLIDGQSMVLLVWLLTGMLADELASHTLISMQVVTRTDSAQHGNFGSPGVSLMSVIRAMSALSWTGCLLAAMWTIFADPAPDMVVSMGVPGGVIFVVALLFFCVGDGLLRASFTPQFESTRSSDPCCCLRRGCLPRCCWPAEDDGELRGFYELRRRFWLGAGAFGVSCFVWVLTETLCDEVLFFRLFPGHVVWHIGAMWGVLNMLPLFAALRLDYKNKRMSWTHKVEEHPEASSSGQLQRWYYVCLPAFVARGPDVTNDLTVGDDTEAAGAAQEEAPAGGMSARCPSQSV